MPVTMSGVPLSPSDAIARPATLVRATSDSSSSGNGAFARFARPDYGSHRGPRPSPPRGGLKAVRGVPTPRGIDEVQAAKTIYVETLASLHNLRHMLELMRELRERIWNDEV